MNYKSSKEREAIISPEPVPSALAFDPVAGEFILTAAERFRERMAEDKPAPLGFAAACKTFGSDHSLHGQLPTLCDQVCGENQAPNIINHQHSRLESAMKEIDSQVHTEHERLAVIPFVQNRPFQNRVSKRDKKYQKVTKSPIRPFDRRASGGADGISAPDIGHLAVNTGS